MCLGAPRVMAPMSVTVADHLEHVLQLNPLSSLPALGLTHLPSKSLTERGQQEVSGSMFGKLVICAMMRAWHIILYNERSAELN
jgi:hypothetical protein